MTENYSSPERRGQPVVRGIVGVLGSGRVGHEALAEPLGDWIARSGFHLLCGGGGGVMLTVSRAFASVAGRRGVAVGVLPGRVDSGGLRSPPGYPNDWIDLPIRTHLPFSGEQGMDPLSRNHINVLSSDVIVALPGGAGTRSEVELAVMYRRPVIAYLGRDGVIEGLAAGAVPVAADLDEVAGFVESQSG